jgi:hypothetical protein
VSNKRVSPVSKRQALLAPNGRLGPLPRPRILPVPQLSNAAFVTEGRVLTMSRASDFPAPKKTGGIGSRVLQKSRGRALYVHKRSVYLIPCNRVLSVSMGAGLPTSRGEGSDFET